MRSILLKGQSSLALIQLCKHPPPWETMNLSVGKQHLSSLPTPSSLLKRCVLRSIHGCIDFAVIFKVAVLLETCYWPQLFLWTITSVQSLSVAGSFNAPPIITLSNLYPCYWQNSQCTILNFLLPQYEFSVRSRTKCHQISVLHLFRADLLYATHLSNYKAKLLF